MTSTVLYAEVGIDCGCTTALVGAPITPTVGYAEVGGTDCGCTTALVSTSTPPTVSFAEVDAGCGCIAALVNASTASAVTFAKAALFCILLTARWVLAPRAHDKKHKSKIITFSLYRSLFNL